MNKFHQIPTDKFVPISHDNSYLFNHYDKVANFLAFNLEKNYKNILAKPVQNGYFLDWFSVHPDLININEKRKEESEIALVKYWNFIDTVNAKISYLFESNDDNSKNWANLLTKVFTGKDNFIFYNGEDICIVWGWKFENNNIYKPNILQSQNIDLINIEADQNTQISLDSTSNVHDAPAADELTDYEVIDEVKEDVIATGEEKGNFLEFLKWIASNYWWLLWVLTLLAALVFFAKTFLFKVT